jgi:hypothetical protein
MMLGRLAVGDYIVEYDRDATIAAYSRIAVPGPEECGCCYCRNWVAGRDRIVPAAVRDLLDAVGVPLNGEIEVWEVPGETQAHGYGGWYILVGAIVSAPLDSEQYFSLGDWRLSFKANRSYDVAAFGGSVVCELHFFTEAPDFTPSANTPAPCS